MVTVIKKPKYSVFCTSCNNTLAFEAEDVIFKLTRHCNVPATEGGEKPTMIDRYFITCPECGGHPNIVKIASAKMKREAKKTR